MGYTGNYPGDNKSPPGLFTDVDLLVGCVPCQAFTVPDKYTFETFVIGSIIGKEVDPDRQDLGVHRQGGAVPYRTLCLRHARGDGREKCRSQRAARALRPVLSVPGPYADEGGSQLSQKWGGDPLCHQGAAIYLKILTLKKGGPHL